MAGKPEATQSEVQRKVIHIAFAQWLRAFLTFALILILDPFGCSTDADRYSENLLMKLRAPFHNGGWLQADVSDSPGQKKVLVVLVDQDTLDEWATSYTGDSERLTWPISRKRQVDWLIGPLLRQQPAALFLDWTYHAEALGEGGTEDTRAARQALLDELAPIKGTMPTRLLLGMRAEGDNPTPGCAVQWATTAGLLRRLDVATSFAGWPSDRDVELVSLLRYDRAQYSPFPLRLRAAGGAQSCAAVKDGETHLAAPAVAMFHVYCQREADRPAATERLCQAFGPAAREALVPTAGSGEQTAVYGYAAPEGLSRHMTLAWPGLRSEEQSDRDDFLAGSSPASAYAGYIKACERTGLSRTGLFRSLLFSAASDGGAGEGCRYGVDWISFAQFDDLVAAGKLSLAARYVLVSPDLPSVPDRVQSSLHGEAPGVFLHAVALENLISRGDTYLQDPPLLRGLSRGTAITLLLGAIVALAVPRFSRLLDTDREGFALAIATVGALLPLIVGVQLTACQGMAPIGWVSLMAASAWIIDEFFESKVIRPNAAGVAGQPDPLGVRLDRKALRLAVLALLAGSLLAPCGWSDLLLYLSVAGLLWLLFTRARQGGETRDVTGLSPWITGFLLPALAVTAAALLAAMMAGTYLAEPLAG